MFSDDGIITGRLYEAGDVERGFDGFALQVEDGFGELLNSS